MSTLVVATLKSNSSSPPAFQNTSGTEIGTLCRAWVNFNGTGTVAIRAQFNVSSITDNGVGDYTVNFTTAITDANYSMVATVGRTTGNDFNMMAALYAGTPFTSSSARFGTKVSTQAGQEDSPNCCVAIFR